MPAGQWHREVLLSAHGQPPKSARHAVPMLPPMPIPSAPGQPEQSPRGPARGWPRPAFCSGLMLLAATLRVFCASVPQPYAHLPGCVLPAALSALLPAPRMAWPFPTPARAAARGRLQVSVHRFCSPLCPTKSAQMLLLVSISPKGGAHRCQWEETRMHVK